MVPLEPWCQPDVLDSFEGRPAPLPDVHTNGAVTTHDLGQQILNAVGIRSAEDKGAQP